METPDILSQIEEATGGTATLHQLKDEKGDVVHAFATLSMPLRKDHWIYQKSEDGFGFPPPMPLRMGAESKIALIITDADPDKNPGWVGGKTLTLDKQRMRQMIYAAGKYAVRSATMHGAEMDFDPDALLQNLVVGFLGYFTHDGFSGDAYDNPKEAWTPPIDPPINSNANTGQAPLP